MFYIYILKTLNNKLYIGHTNNLSRRKLEHKKHHHGAKFIENNHSVFKLVYSEKFESRVEAMRREKQLKGWTRAKKEALISENLKLLKRL